MKKFLPYILLLSTFFLLLFPGKVSARYSQYFDSGCKPDPCGLNYYFREIDCALCATFVNGLCPFGENTSSGYVCKDSPKWGGPYPQCINTNIGYTPDGTAAADFTSFCTSFPPGYFYGFQFYEPPTPTPAPTPTPTPTTFPPCANFGGTCTVSSTCPSGTSEIFGVSCTDPNAICCSNPTATPPPSTPTSTPPPTPPPSIVCTVGNACTGTSGCTGKITSCPNGQFGAGVCTCSYGCSGPNQTCVSSATGIYTTSNCDGVCPTVPTLPGITACNPPKVWTCSDPNCIPISTPTGMTCYNRATNTFCSGGTCSAPIICTPEKKGEVTCDPANACVP